MRPFLGSNRFANPVLTTSGSHDPPNPEKFPLYAEISALRRKPKYFIGVIAFPIVRCRAESPDYSTVWRPLCRSIVAENMGQVCGNKAPR
jgi:hypothetical protein